MHPNRAFAWEDEAEARAFVATVAFAHLFAPTRAGPMVAHVPLLPAPDGGFHFHLARANRIFPHLVGAAVLASVGGPDAYVSPDWYARPTDQVPTWNYVAVEVEGVARRLPDEGLIAHLKALAAAHEARLAPKRPWTFGKVAPERVRAMLDAIALFELTPTAFRGTRKLSQNKNEADRSGVAAALGETSPAMAALLRP